MRFKYNRVYIADAAILCDKVKCIVWEAGGGERGLEDGRALACLWTWQWGAARKPLKGRNRKSFSESRTWKNRNYKIWTWQSHKSLLFRCNESPASCLPFPLLPRGPPKTPIQRFRNRYFHSFKQLPICFEHSWRIHQKMPPYCDNIRNWDRF